MRIGQKAAGYLGSYTWLRAISRRSGGWLARRIADSGGVAATFGKRHEDVGERDAKLIRRRL
jgi:hypothetical protein